MLEEFGTMPKADGFQDKVDTCNFLYKDYQSKKKSNGLFRAILWTFKWELVFMISSEIVIESCQLISNFITKSVIDYINEEGGVGLNMEGVKLIVISAAYIVFEKFAYMLRDHKKWIDMSKAKMMMQQMLYEKVTTMQQGSSVEFSEGQILGFIQSDVYKLEHFFLHHVC